jgi:S1-C subfamily serine protease
LFRRFFGNAEPRSFRSEGSGTGFVVDRNGYILTNYHVVENADRIKVKLAEAIPPNIADGWLDSTKKRIWLF